MASLFSSPELQPACPCCARSIETIVSICFPSDGAIHDGGHVAFFWKSTFLVFPFTAAFGSEDKVGRDLKPQKWKVDFREGLSKFLPIDDTGPLADDAC